MHFLRKTTTMVSGAVLLLGLAGSAFATGGGNTSVTNLQGVTITSALSGTSTCYTVSLAQGATFKYAGGTGTVDKIGGFFIFSSPQVTTTGVAPSGFSADTLNGGGVSGATGYNTGYGQGGSPILPGGSGLFCFNAPAPVGATFLLDIFQTNPGSPFSNTGRISFTLPLPSPVPEASPAVTLSLGILCLLGVALSARKRRSSSARI